MQYGRVSGPSYSAPTFGVVGSIPVSQTLYDRWLLIIAKDRNLKELFEIRAQSTGRVGEISRVMPAMIDSAFADFPGVSGKMKTYNLPVVERGVSDKRPAQLSPGRAVSTGHGVSF